MNIIPISSMPVMTPPALPDSRSAAAESGMSFLSIFQQALENVEETNAVKERNSMALAAGDVDNIAQVMIDSEKAQLAVSMLVEMRNKVLDAYSEIMRISL